MAKPTDLIKSIKYYYRDYSKGCKKCYLSKKFEPNFDNGISSINDHPRYGGCYTATASKEMILRKILRVKLYLKIPRNASFAPTVLSHRPGDFMDTAFARIPPLLNAEEWFRNDYFLDYEVHNKQEFVSEPPCETKEDHNYDKCVHSYIENKTLAKFGCTTPWGLNKDKICTNATIGKQVYKMYETTWKNDSKACKVPCKSISIKPARLKQTPNSSFARKGYTTIVLNMNEKVLISEEVFLYSGLSLIAEVGGYVGLFLGISINQIANMAEILVDFGARKSFQVANM